MNSEVHNLQFVARRRPNWENWKLGDSILACSVLEYFKNVRLHVLNINAPGNQLIQKLSNEIFSDRYQFEMIQFNESSNIVKKIHPDKFFLENNLTVVKANLSFSYTNTTNQQYLTYQNESKHARTAK